MSYIITTLIGVSPFIVYYIDIILILVGLGYVYVLRKYKESVYFEYFYLFLIGLLCFKNIGFFIVGLADWKSFTLSFYDKFYICLVQLIFVIECLMITVVLRNRENQEKKSK